MPQLGIWLREPCFGEGIQSKEHFFVFSFFGQEELPRPGIRPVPPEVEAQTLKQGAFFFFYSLSVKPSFFPALERSHTSFLSEVLVHQTVVMEYGPETKIPTFQSQP